MDAAHHRVTWERLLATVPRLVALEASRSWVVVGVSTAHLTDRPDAIQALLRPPSPRRLPSRAQLLGALHSIATPALHWIVVLYDDQRTSLEARRDVARVSRWIEDAGLPLVDAAWVISGRWIARDCTPAGGCPARGHRLDDRREPLGGRDLAATGDVGAFTWPDEITLVPDDAVEVAIAHAVTHLTNPLDRGDAADARGRDDRLVILGLHDTRVRDTVIWDLLVGEERNLAAIADRMAAILGRSPTRLHAPLSTCLSVLRWQSGDATGALRAVDHALDADPGYALALLLRRCLLAGVDPGEWRSGVALMARRRLIQGPASFA